MFNKLKQFKDIRGQAKQLQNALAGESAKATSGAVTVTINGNQEVVDVAIDPAGYENQTSLPKDIMNATNKAIKEIQKVMALKMREMGDFDINKLLGGDSK